MMRYESLNILVEEITEDDLQDIPGLIGPNAGPVAFTIDNVPKDIQVTIQDSEGTLLQTFRTRNLVIDYSQMGQK